MSDRQLFPALDTATEAALRASIRRHGVLVPVLVDQQGATVDGHHRRRIAAEEQVECPTVSVDVDDEAHAQELAATVNADRRHLSPQQRREIVAELREQGHSLRAIAGAVGASKDTVQRDLAQPGVSRETPGTVKGSDGKSYPATKPPRPTPADVQAEAAAQGEQIDDVEADAIADTLDDPDAGDADLADTVADNLDSKRAPNPPRKPDLGGGVSHPARYSDALIPIIARLLDEHSGSRLRILDPFAGTGRIHRLADDHGHDTVGIEIEPEWAALDSRTIVGSALELPFADGDFDAVVTSPTYGNRLADSHNATDPETRRSYTHDLGRPLADDNSGSLQWGDDYRRFHAAAWDEAHRVLDDDGLLILNIKDHIRVGYRQYVAGWHVTHLCRHTGFDLLHHVEVATPAMRAGANAEARVGGEQLYVLRRVP